MALHRPLLDLIDLHVYHYCDPQNEIAEGNVVICASGEGQCPPDHSCCSVPGSDQVHCCPGGYSCEKGLCQESSIEFPAAIFTSSAAKIVKCNQEFACPER